MEIEKQLEAIDEKIEKVKERRVELKTQKERLQAEQKELLAELETNGIDSDKIYDELNKVRQDIQDKLKKIDIPEDLLS